MSSSSSSSSMSSVMVPGVGAGGEKKKKCCPFGECKYRMKPSDSIMMCRCGSSFCSMHRLPEQHECAYNYRAAAVQHLSSQLVKCAGDRLVDKI